MPLNQGSNELTISFNIAELIKNGKYKPSQAEAIAYKQAGKDCGPSCDGSCGNHGRDSEIKRYLVVSELGEKQALTPEGFLLCKDVPIARTGAQLYGANEVNGIEAVGGIIRIERDAEEVFRPETIASFEGKPVTNDHPVEDVSPDNWKKLAVGVVQNVRRGLGTEDNLLLADLLITDREAIAAVRDGKREVSCGYDTRFEQTAPGRGRQTNIVGNHVALVDNGRCGARCAIKDKGDDMTKANFKDRIMAAFKSQDQKALDAVLEEGDGAAAGTPGGNIHVHVATRDKGGKDEGEEGFEERVKKMEDKMRDWENEKEEKKKAEDKARDEEEKEKEKEKERDKAKDSLVDFGLAPGTPEERIRDADTKYTEIRARAEILAPGITLPKPKVDAVRDGKAFDALCVIKRFALTEAMRNDTGKRAITPFLEGKALDSLSCGAVEGAFLGASEIIKNANNGRANPRVNTTDAKTVDAFTKGGLDKINSQFWDKAKKGN